MKVIISELWDTGIQIVTTEDEFDGICSISDLRSCENVLVGKRIKGTPATEVMIDDDLYYVSFRTVTHPTGLGKLIICETL